MSPRVTLGAIVLLSCTLLWPQLSDDSQQAPSIVAGRAATDAGVVGRGGALSPAAASARPEPPARLAEGVRRKSDDDVDERLPLVVSLRHVPVSQSSAAPLTDVPVVALASRRLPDRGLAPKAAEEEDPPVPPPTGNQALPPPAYVGYRARRNTAGGRSIVLPPGFMPPAGKASHFMADFPSLSVANFIGAGAGKQGQVSGEAVCELNVYYTGNCDMDGDTSKESWLECARRIGPKRFDKVLSSRCRQTDAWKRLVLTDLAETGANSAAELASVQRGWVATSQIEAAGAATPRYLAPAQRNVAVFDPPRRCSIGCSHHPISFGMPDSAVAPRVTRHKWWDFVPYVPQPNPSAESGAVRHGAWSVNDEWLKDQFNRHSYFGFTSRRSDRSWQSLRTLEILAAGAIPYFADIEMSPRRALSNFPKALMKEAMSLPGVDHVGQARRNEERIDNEFFSKRPGAHIKYKKPGTLRMQNFDRESYFEIADKLLEHVRKHMTCTAVVSYMLRTVGFEEPKRVLVIGRGEYDFMQQTVEHGLSELGINTTVADPGPSWTQKVPAPEGDAYISENELEMIRTRAASVDAAKKGIPGLTWMYGFRSSRLNIVRIDPGGKGLLARRISDGDFDLVIYVFGDGTTVSDLPLWREVRAAMPSARRVFIQVGEDLKDPDEASLDACQHGILFKRDMQDVDC